MKGGPTFSILYGAQLDYNSKGLTINHLGGAWSELKKKLFGASLKIYQWKSKKKILIAKIRTTPLIGRPLMIACCFNTYIQQYRKDLTTHGTL